MASAESDGETMGEKLAHERMSSNPFEPPAHQANEEYRVSQRIQYELTEKDLQGAASRCAMQLNSVFGSATMFVIGALFIVGFAYSANVQFQVIYWMVSLVAAFVIQHWRSKPIRRRILENSHSDPTLRPGEKIIHLDPNAGSLSVEFHGDRKHYDLGQLSIKSTGEPTANSSIVLEAELEHLLVIPTRAFLSPGAYNEFLKLLRKAIRNASQFESSSLANSA